MSSSHSDNISAGWYIAFFLGGALLGLLVLNYFSIDLPLPADNTTTVEKTAPAVPPRHAQRNAVKAPQPPTPQVAAPAGSTLATPEQADTANTPESVQSEQPATQPEPFICNKKHAAAIRNKAREVAEIVITGSALVVRLRKEWEYYSDSVKRSFVEQFADSDTCLNGSSRTIQFFYQGKLFATADPERGVVFEP